MPDEEAKKANDELQHCDLPCETVLAERPTPDKPQVEYCEVGSLCKRLVLRVEGDVEETKAGEELQQAADERGRLAVGGPGSRRGLEEPCAGVEAREAMAGTGDEAEDLGHGIEEVEDLGDEEEAEGLGEVAEDADDSKHHTGEVTVCITDKDAGREPVVAEEGGGNADPGKEEVEREEVGVGGRVRVGCEEVEAVVEGE